MPLFWTTSVSLVALLMVASDIPPHPRGYVCYRASEALQIDGRLDDPAWQNAPWTDNFVDIEGDRKPLPRFRTRARMLWDDEYFYIGAELEEPHVWATLTEHDSVIFHDNDFEIFIDPDGDNHEYYEIEINALNTEWDLRLVKPYRDGGPALNEWEVPGLKTAVHVDGTLNDPSDLDRGWSVEFALPWEALAEYAGSPAPPRNGDQWRVNFSRVEWLHEIVEGKYCKVPDTREDNWVWSPQGVINMHRPETWGYVQFSTETGASVPLRPDPAFPAKMLLHHLYETQRKYHKEEGTWAADVRSLSVLQQIDSLVSGPTIRATPDGYVASVEIAPADGPHQRWHIRQDSRLWRE